MSPNSDGAWETDQRLNETTYAIRLGDIAPNFTAQTTKATWISTNGWGWLGVLFSHGLILLRSLHQQNSGPWQRSSSEFAKRTRGCWLSAWTPIEKHHGWIKEINETRLHHEISQYRDPET